MRVVDSTLSLFPDLAPSAEPSWLPPGFSYEREFLTPAQEQRLLAGIAGLNLRNSQYHEYTALRRTAGFGLRWSYDSGALGPAPPAPDFLAELAARVAQRFNLPPGSFPHVLVTEYPPGAPMGWHRDAPPFGEIYGVSLGGPCTFRLRPYEKQLQTRDATIRLHCEPRSLYAMRGESRTRWQHSIAPVPQTRYSITLRTLRRAAQAA